MANNTIGQKGVTADGNRETDRPHNPQHLQDIMADTDIRDMAKWADVVVENEIPRLNDKSFYESDQGFVPLIGGVGFRLGQD
jgi:hypothetical protein